jgi:4-hydroxy-3-polyprenylbenzoate decarboxylase
LDALDHASNRAFQGFRLGIDATSGLPLECKTEGFDLSFESIQSGLKHGVLGAQVRIENFEKDKGIRAGAYMLDKMASEPQLRFLILVDDWIDISCLSTVSWKIFNNIDPKRDMIIETREDGRLFVGIDATKKGIEDGLMRPWPDDIVMSDDIKEKVDKRWSAYGIRD